MRKECTPSVVKRALVDDMSILMPLIQERLDAGQSVQFYPRGVSMLPMLRQDMDSVVISPITRRLRRYDIVLYQRENGKYVLHRIIKVGETYTCIGDHQYTPEPELTHSQMLAVVTGFYRAERFYKISNPGYHAYCILWHHTRALRKTYRRGMGWLRRKLKQ